MTFVRRDVWALASDDPIIANYRAAVGAMQARDPDDPTSWSFQAAMHGSHDQPGAWPFNQCKHASWFFLPWHRMYVWYFEQIVRAAIPNQGAAADWALPFWNYGAGGQDAKLPEPFQGAQVDGQPNPLFVAERAPGMNDGRGSIPPAIGVPTAALNCTTFIGPTRTQPTPEFGGGPADPSIQFSRWTGVLENSPHNMVHDLVGGKNGWMADPDQAAQDPVFWLHHSNIDRIWNQWIAEGQGRADPGDADWTGQAFKFYGPDGTEVSLTCDQVLDTAQQLDYEYEEPARPQAHVPVPRLAAQAPVQAGGDGAGAPEPVGASQGAVQLTGDTESVTVDIDQRAQAAVVGEAEAPRRVLLTVQEIETEDDPGTPYGIYLNLPDGADAEAAAAHYAGAVSFFGAKRASHPRGDEAPHSLVVTHDITNLVHGLRAEGEWDGQHVTVTFRPLGLVPPDAPEQVHAGDAGGEGHAPVTIGQVRILYA